MLSETSGLNTPPHRSSLEETKNKATSGHSGGSPASVQVWAAPGPRPQPPLYPRHRGSGGEAIVVPGMQSPPLGAQLQSLNLATTPGGRQLGGDDCQLQVRRPRPGSGRGHEGSCYELRWQSPGCQAEPPSLPSDENTPLPAPCHAWCHGSRTHRSPTCCL